MSAAKLARYMRIEAPVANQLFCKLVSDGVLGTPCAAGSASALKPIAKPTASHATGVVRRIQNAAEKLVKDDAVLLDANQHQDDLQESTHASPDQHLQESPARGWYRYRLLA
jgi:hypothetical protein